MSGRACFWARTPVQKKTLKAKYLEISRLHNHILKKCMTFPNCLRNANFKMPLDCFLTTKLLNWYCKEVQIYFMPFYIIKIFKTFGSNITTSWPPTVKNLYFFQLFMLILTIYLPLLLVALFLEILQKHWGCQNKNNKKRIWIGL